MPKSPRVPSYSSAQTERPGCGRPRRQRLLRRQARHCRPQAEYHRLVREWTAAEGTPPAATDFTIAELLAAFVSLAKGYHRPAEQQKISLAMRPLKKDYAKTRADYFGPRALEAVRQAMIDADLARTTIKASAR